MINQEEFVWQLCYQKVEKKFGHGEVKSWTNKEFQLLSDDILKLTKLYISLSSLKRIFGKVEYAFKPQQETKNALAKYIGYLSWEDFVMKCNSEQISETEIVISQSKTIPTKKSIYLLYCIPIIIIIVFAIYSLFGLTKSTFSVDKNKGFSPLLVTFKYDITHSGKDKVEINYDDQSFVVNEELSILKNTINYSFRTPDIYYVKFIQRGKILKKIPIIAQSNGWYTTICNYDLQDKNLFKHLIGNDSYKHNGEMQVAPATVKNYGFDTLQNFWIKYRNIRDFKLDGSVFEYETKLRNKIGFKGQDYPEVVLSIMGEKNKITAIFRYPGTNGKWATYYFSEKEIKVEDQNMSAFDCNLNGWHIIKVNVKNKTVRFYIDSKEIYHENFTEEIGHIYGLMLQSKGFGEFDYVKLSDSNNKSVYFEDFN